MNNLDGVLIIFTKMTKINLHPLMNFDESPPIWVPWVEFEQLFEGLHDNLMSLIYDIYMTKIRQIESFTKIPWQVNNLDDIDTMLNFMFPIQQDLNRFCNNIWGKVMEDWIKESPDEDIPHRGF